MDDYLFIALAQLKADRLQLEREGKAARGPATALALPSEAAARLQPLPGGRTHSKATAHRVVGMGLSLIANAVLLGGVYWQASAQQRAPAGEVQIIEMGAVQSAPPASYARLHSDRRV